MNGHSKPVMESGIFVARIICLVLVGFSTVYGVGLQTGKEGQAGSRPPAGPPAQSPGRAGNSVLVSPDEDYRIGLNDVLEIRVENAPELSQTYRVTAAGTFLMPWVGRVVAAKKTPEELAQTIGDKLKGDFLKDPKVSVLVKEYNSRSFFVQGSVRSPGVYQIEGRPSMLELLTLAGGLADTHGANAYIIRRIKTTQAESPAGANEGTKGGATNDPEASESPKYELKSANINGLLKGHFEQDVVLEPGDIVNIPPSDLFFVAGEVNAPGSFPLKEGTTLRQAIALAQGTNYKAALGRGIIFRENESGKREEVHVDIGAVMSAKMDDIPIMANDIIMVPNSRAKSVGGALLKAFGLTTVTRMPLP